MHSSRNSHFKIISVQYSYVNCVYFILLCFQRKWSFPRHLNMHKFILHQHVEQYEKRKKEKRTQLITIV